MATHSNFRFVLSFVALFSFSHVIDHDSAKANHLSELRIAVLGAGASGLTAARQLKKLGYENIVVFEKGSDVGGKVDSVLQDGLSFELGAVWVSHDYSIIREIAREEGIEFINDVAPRFIVYSDGSHFPFESYLFKKNSPIEIISALIHFEYIKKKYQLEWNPGFSNASPDLYQDFQTFSERHGIKPIADVFEPFFVACGYGYYKEVPAIYILKLMKMMLRVFQFDLLGHIPGVQLAGLQTVAGGFQEIWRRTASHLNVQTKSKLTSIRRISENGSPKLELRLGERTEVFDRVVSSLPLPELNEIMDVNDFERNLFSKVKTYSYWVSLFHESQLAKGRSFFMKESTHAETLGQPIVLANRYQNSDLWVAYQLADPSWSPIELATLLKTGVQKLGGDLTELVLQKRWDYFPHVKTRDLQEGFYQKLEAMQGEHGFYFVGGIMGFETTEHSAEYAKNLIETKFR